MATLNPSPSDFQQVNCNSSRLVIGATEVRLDSSYVIRWADTSGGDAQAVLYQNGKRVTREWTLELAIRCPADAYGGNANTD